MNALSKKEIERYSRQWILPEIGVQGQERLKNARVLIVGVGGLGCPAALSLAAAGVGRLGLVDFDRVSLSNLPRQTLFETADVGQLKVEIAKKRLEAINPEIEIQAYPQRAEDSLNLIREYDLLIDATDDFQTRYTLNDACLDAQVPYVYGAVQGFEGQVSVFFSPHGPCYRCLFPSPPQAATTCEEGGVLGMLPGIIGQTQALEACKLILGMGEPLLGRVSVFDGLRQKWLDFELPRRPDCRCCGKLENSTDELCVHPDRGELEAEQLEEWMRTHPDLQIVDVRTVREFQSGFIPGSLNIPLDQLEERYSELDPARETLLYCKAGVRSEYALEFLKQVGFSKICHLMGGILRISPELLVRPKEAL